MAEENNYPAVRLLVRSGGTIAVLVALLALIGGGWLALAGQGWGWAVAGVVLGALAYGFVRLLVELVQIIADTLLPQ